MTEDARLGGPAISALVTLLAQSVRDEARIQSIATNIGLNGKVTWRGAASDQWSALVNVAKDRTAEFASLLSAVDYEIKETIYYGDFLKWRAAYDQGSQSGPSRLHQAVSDVRKFRNSLLTGSDPRKGRIYLRPLRASIMEIREIVEAMPGKLPGDHLVLEADAEDIAAARSEILSSCGKSLSEVDQLIVDIDEAKRQSGRVKQESTALEAFAADHGMIRMLLADRNLVVTELQALLDVIDRQLAHLGIPTPDLGPQGQGVPAQRGEQ